MTYARAPPSAQAAHALLATRMPPRTRRYGSPFCAQGVDFMGMAPCEGTGAVPADTNAHMILLAGIFIGGVMVLVRGQVGMTANGCVLKIKVRSSDQEISQIVADCIQ